MRAVIIKLCRHSKPPYNFCCQNPRLMVRSAGFALIFTTKWGILGEWHPLTYMGNILLPKWARKDFIYEILFFTTILNPLSNAHVSGSQCIQCKQEIMWRLLPRDLPPFECAKGSGNNKTLDEFYFVIACLTGCSAKYYWGSWCLDNSILRFLT